MELQVFQEPFPYVYFSNVLPENTINLILSKLENESAWLPFTDHLSQLDVFNQISSTQNFYNDPNILNLLHKAHDSAQNYLGILLKRQARLHVHRFLPGSAISLHTDATEKGARLLFFLKPDLQTSQGGGLLFTNRLSGLTKLFAPTNNTAILFFTDPNWFHAVTEQIEGKRYSMVFQLFINSYSTKIIK